MFQYHWQIRQWCIANIHPRMRIIIWARCILLKLRSKSGKLGPVKPVNHTRWVAVVTPTDRPKSVRNRCVIELIGRCLFCHFALWHFCWCRVFVIGLSQIASLFSKTPRRASLLLATWMYYCPVGGMVNFTLRFKRKRAVSYSVLWQKPLDPQKKKSKKQRNNTKTQNSTPGRADTGNRWYTCLSISWRYMIVGKPYVSIPWRYIHHW